MLRDCFDDRNVRRDVASPSCKRNFTDNLRLGRRSSSFARCLGGNLIYLIILFMTTSSRNI
jgi:hypothetical protein